MKELSEENYYSWIYELETKKDSVNGTERKIYQERIDFIKYYSEF